MSSIDKLEFITDFAEALRAGSLANPPDPDDNTLQYARENQDKFKLRTITGRGLEHFVLLPFRCDESIRDQFDSAIGILGLNIFPDIDLS